MSTLTITADDADAAVDEAIARFGWTREDWDEIAGVVIVGRLLTDLPAGITAEIRADGSAVLAPITADDVRARLLAETSGLELVGPDATVRLNSVRLAPDGPDHVLVHSVRGLPAPGMAPPPLQRRTPKRSLPEPNARKVAPTVSTHPETISVLLEDLNRRRLTAGAADDESVHWDSLPMTAVPLGRAAGTVSGASNIAVWVATEDAYDWLQWYLSIERFRALLMDGTAGPDELTIERDVLPNLNALNFVVTGGPAAALLPRVQAAIVDVPDELLT